MTWHVSYKLTSKSEAVQLELRADSLAEAAEAFAAWRQANGVDYHSVTFEAV